MAANEEERGDIEASIPVMRESFHENREEAGKKRFNFKYACASLAVIVLINLLNFCFEVLNYDSVQNAFKLFISKKLNSSGIFKTDNDGNGDI